MLYFVRLNLVMGGHLGQGKQKAYDGYCQLYFSTGVPCLGKMLKYSVTSTVKNGFLEK